MREVNLGTAPVEFWSSVEYGTFLKGLVRSAVRQNLRRKRLRGD